MSDITKRVEQVGYEKGGQRAASFLQNGDEVLESKVQKEQPLVLMLSLIHI